MEDALLERAKQKIPNSYLLVSIAGARVDQLMKGYQPKVEVKGSVLDTAFREICEGKILPGEEPYTWKVCE